MSQQPLSAFEHDLMTAIQARQPGLVIFTLEERRAIVQVARVVQELIAKGRTPRTIIRWSAASHVQILLNDPERPRAANADAPFPPQPEALLKSWSEGPTAAPSILIMCDMERMIEHNSTLVRVLRETLERIRGKPQNIVLINKEFKLPDELRQGLLTFRLPLPNVKQLTSLVEGTILHAKEKLEALKNIEIDAGTIQSFARAVTGLTEAEVDVMVKRALVDYLALDARAVSMAHREKASVLLKGGVLVMQEPRFGFHDIGGLDHAKYWAQQITPIIADPAEAKHYGLKIPSGLLLVGCPGTGKSLLAESLAYEWKLPMLRFDVGSCFASLVGESEQNVRRMIEVANSLMPCVVFVDEIEKGLGGDSHDGGTTSRVKQTLLTWLQDKPEQIFVVATANDLTRLERMPELIRAGRFDQKFFVDLPDDTARQEIFRLHFGKVGHNMESDILREAALATRRFSGAEIETIVQQALRIAYAARPRAQHPTKVQILMAVREIKPLADTMAESISRLRAWCRDGRAKLAGGQMEAEEAQSLDGSIEMGN